MIKQGELEFLSTDSHGKFAVLYFYMYYKYIYYKYCFLMGKSTLYYKLVDVHW